MVEGAVRSAAGRLATSALALVLVACGGDRAASIDDPGPDGGSAPSGSLTVFATASLTDAFTDLATEFETATPGATVTLSFAGSSSLREQVLAGAPADVLAFADRADMDRVVAAGEAGPPQVFATNRLQIAVPLGNAGGITGLDDFARDDLLLGLCAAEVPCGRLARQVLAAAGVEPALDTNEPDVRALLTKLKEDELDAGIVYWTDVLAAEREVEGIDIPDEVNVVVDYPVAVLTSSSSTPLAEAFVAFVLSDGGQAALARHGFGPP